MLYPKIKVCPLEAWDEEMWVALGKTRSAHLGRGEMAVRLCPDSPCLKTLPADQRPWKLDAVLKACVKPDGEMQRRARVHGKFANWPTLKNKFKVIPRTPPLHWLLGAPAEERDEVRRLLDVLRKKDVWHEAAFNLLVAQETPRLLFLPSSQPKPGTRTREGDKKMRQAIHNELERVGLPAASVDVLKIATSQAFLVGFLHETRRDKAMAALRRYGMASKPEGWAGNGFASNAIPPSTIDGEPNAVFEFRVVPSAPNDAGLRRLIYGKSPGVEDEDEFIIVSVGKQPGWL